jgi:Na+-transporting methylmalonyl-CoA/oxaloacetate decarboxylase gamma subunit
MKKITMRVTVLLLIAIFILSFAACSNSGSNDAPDSGSASYTTDESAAYEDTAADESVAYDSAAADVPVPASAEDGQAQSVDKEKQSMAAAADASTGDGAGAGAGISDTNRKITFSASFILDTKKYDADYAKINQLVGDAGGYIASEETRAYPYEDELTAGRSSHFSVRIPVKGYDSFLTKLEKVGQVANKNKSSEDLTSEYFDTEARIEMLELRKERLTGYIKSATKAADIVAFERELSDVLLQLDDYEGNKRRLDQLVDYASVDVTLNELITPETIGKDGEPLGSRASDAFSLSMTGVGAFLQNAAVFFAGAAPVLALIAILLIIIWVIVRLVRRARESYYEKHPGKRKPKKQQYVPYAAVQSQPQPQQVPPQQTAEKTDTEDTK